MMMHDFRLRIGSTGWSGFPSFPLNYPVEAPIVLNRHKEGVLVAAAQLGLIDRKVADAWFSTMTIDHHIDLEIISFLDGGTPQIIHCNRIYHYTPSSYGVPPFLETRVWRNPTPQISVPVPPSRMAIHLNLGNRRCHHVNFL